MEYLIALLSEHRLLTLFAGVFAEQAGAPIPAFPLLLIAGMEAYDSGTHAVQALIIVTIASLLADMLWFWGGRRHGLRILSLLCKLAISPDSCVRQNEVSFARYGVATLVIAKFVPGLSTLARPMAGALGMSTRTFLIFNLAGTVLWAGSGIGLGILFHEQIQQLLKRLEALGSLAMIIVAALLGAYIALRLWRRLRLSRLKAKLPQIHPAELAQMLTKGSGIVILDVQSSARKSLQPHRIQGAIHLDLKALDTNQLLLHLPPDAHVVVYCGCPNDVSAVRAAHALGRRGIKAKVLLGGIKAWTQAGLPLEHTSDIA